MHERACFFNEIKPLSGNIHYIYYVLDGILVPKEPSLNRKPSSLREPLYFLQYLGPRLRLFLTHMTSSTSDPPTLSVLHRLLSLTPNHLTLTTLLPNLARRVRFDPDSTWDCGHSHEVSCLRFVLRFDLVSAARFVVGRGSLELARMMGLW